MQNRTVRPAWVPRPPALWMAIALVGLGLSSAQAAPWPEDVSPSDVCEQVDLADRILDQLLDSANIQVENLPHQIETTVMPMHVYQVHGLAIEALHHLEHSRGLRPIPIVVSTPMDYAPADVRMLSQMLVRHLRKLAQADGLVSLRTPHSFEGKSSSDMLALIGRVLVKIKALDGPSKVSRDEVYAQVLRARRDMATVVRTVARRINGKPERKRFLMSASFGVHPDGSALEPPAPGLGPMDAFKAMLAARRALNDLRVALKHPAIPVPSIEGVKIGPADVLIQTQIIIADINLIKAPFKVESSTGHSKRVAGKTPSDVVHEAQHIAYMAQRLLAYTQQEASR